MRKFALIAAAAIVTAATAMPASARDYCDTHRCRDRGPVGAAADTAAGIAGAAIGTAGAIAMAPFRDSRDSYAYDRGYYGPDGCRPGTWVRDANGRRYRCR